MEDSAKKSTEQSDKVEAAIQYYQRAHEEFAKNQKSKGFERGKEVVLNKVVQISLLRLLTAERQFASRQYLNIRDKWWIRIFDDEMVDFLADYRDEHENDENFLDGFFNGIVDQWEEIERCIV